MKLEPGKYYKTLNDCVVRIVEIKKEHSWGIHGQYVTGPLANGYDLWTSDYYPYVNSFDPKDEPFGLTQEEVTPEEHPEYFI